MVGATESALNSTAPVAASLEPGSYRKDDDGRRVDEHCGADLRTCPFEVLDRGAEMGNEFSRRRKEAMRKHCAEALELVDMDDERRPLFGCLITKRQGDKLAVLRLAGVE